MKKNPNEYSDCAAILDAALARGGAVYTLPNYGAAVRWAQRSYNLRKALRALQEEVLLPGQAPFTKYDDVILRVEKKDKANPSRPHKVVIEIKRMQGQLSDFDGNAVDPYALTTTTPSSLDETFNIDDLK